MGSSLAVLCMISASSSEPTISISKNVILLSSDDKQLSVSRRLLASESTYFRSLFTGNFRDSCKPSHKLPFAGELISEVVSAIQKVSAQEIPIWSLSKSCNVCLPPF